MELAISQSVATMPQCQTCSFAKLLFNVFADMCFFVCKARSCASCYSLLLRFWLGQFQVLSLFLGRANWGDRTWVGRRQHVGTLAWVMYDF